MQVEKTITTPSGLKHKAPMKSVKIESASLFAAGRPGIFNQWLMAVGIGQLIEGELDSKHHVLERFEDFKELTLPQSVLELTSAVGEEELLKDIKDWAEKNVEKLTEQDDCRIVDQWPALSVAFRQIRTSHRRQDNEAGRRRGVDLMIEIAMDWNTSEEVTIRFEQHVQLCRTDPAIVLERIPSSSAIADTLVIITTEHEANERLEDHILRSMGSDGFNNMYWERHTPSQISLIGFSCEYGRRAARGSHRQTIYNLATAQKQRRALGLPQKPLSGGSFFEGILYITTMWWNDGLANRRELRVFRHAKGFRLTNPIEFINAYSFLCKLGKEIQNFGDAVDGLDPQVVSQALEQHPWRALQTEQDSDEVNTDDGDDVRMEEYDDEDDYDDAEDYDSSSESIPVKAMASLPQNPIPLTQRVRNWLDNVIDEPAVRMVGSWEGSEAKPL